MKYHFTETFETASYDFIEEETFPARELVTCVFAFLHLEGKIFLTKNHRGWELPGGHIEEGESFDEALDREMKEEVGTTIYSKQLFGYKKYTNQKQIPDRKGGYYPFPHSYIMFYLAEATGRDEKIDCPDTLDYGLFSIDEALNKVNSQGTKKIIQIMRNFI